MLPLAASAAEPPQPVAILPAEGDRALASPLRAELVAAVAARVREPVLRPSELASRLWRAPGVATAVTEARTFITQAEQRLFYMDRQAAISAARGAAALLAKVGGKYHSPQLWSHAQATLARALLLKPADAAGARAALASALAATPDLPPGSLPPQLADLLQEAARRTTASPPDLAQLRGLASQAEVGWVVWVAARARGGGAEIDLLVFDAKSQTLSQRVGRRTPAPALVGDAAGEVANLISRRGGPAAGVSGGSSDTATASVLPGAGGASPPVESKPWYTRWWVWTAVGAVVVAAAAVGGGVAATRHEGYRVKFEFK